MFKWLRRRGGAVRTGREPQSANEGEVIAIQRSLRSEFRTIHPTPIEMSAEQRAMIIDVFALRAFAHIKANHRSFYERSSTSDVWSAIIRAIDQTDIYRESDFQVALAIVAHRYAMFTQIPRPLDEGA